MENKENRMGTLPEGELLARMAIPMMFSMLLQALYNVVDSYFVSRVSQDAFNALSLAFPLQSLMIALGSGTGLGINALISRSLGQRDQEMADRTANSGVVLFALCALLFSVIGVTLLVLTIAALFCRMLAEFLHLKKKYSKSA